MNFIGEINNSFDEVLHLLLFSWLDVPVEHLDCVSSDIQMRPVQMCPFGLDQQQLVIVEGYCPNPTMGLSIGLKQLVSVEKEWALKLCLVETYDLQSVLAKDVVHLLLLLC